MFKISQDYIDEGVRDDNGHCPIALCLRRTVDNRVRVSRGHLYCPLPLSDWAKNREIRIYNFSDALRAWVERFDSMLSVPEITIELFKDKFFIEGETYDNANFGS